MAAPQAELDHVTVMDVLSTTVPQGGKHTLLGTHNALAQLGDEKFLEIPAIDPEAERPKRPRWFGLDMPDVQEALTARASDDFSHWFDAPEDVRAQAARRSTSPR